VIAIPKAADAQHVEENRAAGEIELSAAERKAIDAAFPPPKSRKSLEMI
jgi:diketogulonate reductase-like aldo/keto reductase